MDKARKEMLAEASSNYTESIFESIKHVNEYGVDSGMRENYRQHWSINSGVDLRI